MNDWNFKIDEAPKSHIKKVAYTTKDGEREREVITLKPVILATKCKRVVKSCWLPKEGRWEMLGKDEQPLAWMPWPEWRGK